MISNSATKNFCVTILQCAFYIIFYFFAYIVVRKLYPASAIFYQGILILLFSAIICFVLFYFVDKRLKCGMYVNSMACIISIFAAYSIHITIPSLLDRSISLYILGLTAENYANTKSEYERMFYEGFVQKNGAIEKRLDEQVLTGNLELENGRYKLTSRGTRLYKIDLFLANLFNVEPYYVSPSMKK